jgi:RHH-type proline utilization regulon transcriptional repressor/proline dehydrogenase/delta 1-pyrroline-5-carboxylate dehydrogenase
VLSEEIFGPLLAVEPRARRGRGVRRRRRAPVRAHGGLFSRNPRPIERVARRLPVGNLYVNRGITGAMVGRQPFGGNRRSGIGSKAGGPDYLLQFVEPRVVTENTMRTEYPSE